MYKYIFTTLISFFLITTIAKAQKSDATKSTKTAVVAKDTVTKKDTVPHKKSSLKIGLTYSSNAVYLARTDSIATPNYGLGLTYTLKSGIFFAAEVNYIPSRQFDKLDAGGLEAGYNFDLDNLSGGIAISKYIASFNSTQVVSALDATIGAGLSYNLFNVITPSIHADYALVKSGGNDFLLTGGLGHEFEFGKVFTQGDHLSFEPKAEVVAGTQNFLSTYYTRKKNSAAQRQAASLKGKGKNSTSTSTTTTTSSPQTTAVTSSASKFQTLAYEYALPISYSWKKIGFSITPTYAVAVHKIADDGTTTTYLPNSSVFYVQVGLSYTF